MGAVGWGERNRTACRPGSKVRAAIPYTPIFSEKPLVVAATRGFVYLLCFKLQLSLSLSPTTRLGVPGTRIRVKFSVPYIACGIRLTTICSGLVHESRSGGLVLCPPRVSCGIQFHYTYSSLRARRQIPRRPGTFSTPPSGFLDRRLSPLLSDGMVISTPFLPMCSCRSRMWVSPCSSR